MKSLIILLTSLLLTLNTLSVGIMWVQSVDNQTDSALLASNKLPCHQISSGLTGNVISLCGMDNCQCEHLNTAQVPTDTATYQLLSIISKAPSVIITVSRPASPYLTPNYRPPRVTLT